MKLRNFRKLRERREPVRNHGPPNIERRNRRCRFDGLDACCPFQISQGQSSQVQAKLVAHVLLGYRLQMLHLQNQTDQSLPNALDVPNLRGYLPGHTSATQRHQSGAKLLTARKSP